MKPVLFFAIFIFLPFFLVAQKKMSSAEQLSMLQNKVQILQAEGKYDSAIIVHTNLVALHKKSANHKMIIEVEQEIANCYIKQNKYALAINQLDICVKDAQRYFGRINPITAELNNAKGLLHYTVGEFNDALIHFLQAAEIIKRIHGEKHELIGIYYTNIGLVNSKKSFFYQAIEYYNKALFIKKKVLGEMHPQIAELYNFIGDAHSGQGSYDKALEFQLKSLEMRQALLGEKNAATASSYLSIANVYKEKGYYDKALEYSSLSLNLQRQILGEKSNEVANSYKMIGDIYVAKGLYDKGLSYFDKFLALEKELFGEKHPDIAKAYNNIGAVYQAKGLHSKALPYFKKALEMQEEFFDGQHLDIAITYNNLGAVHAQTKEYDKALAYYEAAFNLQQELLGAKNSKSSAFINSYTKMGEVYLADKQTEKAAEIFEKNLVLQKEILGEKHPEVAQTYNFLGDVALQQGKEDKALTLYQQAIIANIPTFYETDAAKNPNWHTQHNFFQYQYLRYALQQKETIFYHRFQKTHNLEDLKICYALLESIDNFADVVKKNQLEENEKMKFLEQINNSYQHAVTVCLQLAENQQDMFIEKAFYFSEKNKATLLLNKLSDSKAKSFAGLPDSLLRKEQELITQIAKYQGLILEAESQNNVELLPAFKTNLFGFKQQYEQLLATFEHDFPQYHELKYNTKIASIKELQNILDNRTAIVEYVVTDTNVYAFLISKKAVDIQTIKKDSTFERLVIKLRNTMYYKVSSLYAEAAYELYSLIFPKKLDKVEHLIIIPDDILHNIPFDALLTKPYITKQGKDFNYSELDYLVKDFDLSYNYSATLFWQIEMRQQKQKGQKNLKRKAENTFVALAPVFPDDHKSNVLQEHSERFFHFSNKEYEQDSLAEAQFFAAYPEARLQTTQHKNQRAFDRSGNHITPLPETEIEVQTIVKSYQQQKMGAKSYIFQEATEKSVKEGILSNAQYIHFATHGLVNKTQPEFSGLLLAQNGKSEEDDILFAGEIYGLSLHADLVTLSACETGLGKFSKGEGVVGLTRAFLYAGAENIMVSLWKVSDSSTSLLMIEFYKQLLNGKTKAESLRKTKLAMLKDKKFNKPYYWSPFVIIGR
jgi:CHAT domain-containing protein